MAEIALVSSGTLKAGRCRKVSAYYLSDQFVQNAEIQSFPRQVLTRRDRNTSALPYRVMHMYAHIHE